MLALIAASSTLTLDTPFAQEDETIQLPNVTVTGTRLVPGPGRGPARSGRPSGTTSTQAEPAPPSGEVSEPSGVVTGTIVEPGYNGRMYYFTEESQLLELKARRAPPKKGSK